MSTSNKRPRGRDAGYLPLDQVNEEEGEDASPGQTMDTRGRTLAIRRPPTTSNCPTATSPFDAPFPQLPPTTPLGKPSSPGKSPRKSPSKSPVKSRTGSLSNTDSAGSSSKEIIKKEQLAQMSPSVRFGDIELVKDKSVPKTVFDFWAKYMMLAIDEDKVVPKELKVNCSILSTDFSDSFPDVALLGSAGRQVQHADEDATSNQGVVLCRWTLHCYRHVESPGHGGRCRKGSTRAAEQP